jgi:hypothetical protein
MCLTVECDCCGDVRVDAAVSYDSGGPMLASAFAKVLETFGALNPDVCKKCLEEKPDAVTIARQRRDSRRGIDRE